MPDTPLNPDALVMGAKAIIELQKEASPWKAGFDDMSEGTQALVTAEFAVGMKAYLAVAQPEVNSVESIPAQVQVISWEEEPEHECWKLAPDETFVGLIVKSDREWSPADRYTLNIERPEVNNGR